MQNSRYPTVRITQCKHFDSNIMPYGVRYCPDCNSIILAMALFPKKKVEELIIEVINHETQHWWLCTNIDEEASIGFDVINEPKNAPDEDLEIPDDLRNILTQFLPDKYK